MTSIFPVSASVGQEFSGYSFDGESWNLIGNEFNPTSFSSSPPLNPKAGDLWVDSDEDVDIIDDQNLVFQNDLNDYLSLSSASSTYLSKTSASTNYATKEYADNSSSVAAAALVDAAPSTLNTLNELAAALGDDANFATTITNALSPIGSVTAYALPTPPAGWLLCDGSIYSASAYPTLSVGLGSTYGGNGTTTFAVPNLKGRIPVGLDSSQTEFDTRGETGGAKTHTLTSAEIPAHSHPNTASFTGSAGTTGNDSPDHAHGPSSSNFALWTGGIVGLAGGGISAPSGMGVSSSTAGANARHQHSFTPAGTVTITNNNNTGGGGAHNNLQPYLVMNYIIRAV
jgi:microcystin-dependent protein